MNYTVVILRLAQKEHLAIPSPTYELIEHRLLALSGDPRPPGCKKLKGAEAAWRIRAGDYRILYEIDDARAVVTVATICHRKDVYR
ncbi:MAG: type II toxin-antitoxin system RelE/ParE family toxin [Candidatus Acidiferrales bacterium]